MNAKQLGREMATALPEIKSQLTAVVHLNCAVALIEVVTRYTQKMIEECRDQPIEDCMKLVNTLYQQGDLILRNAIEYTFVFSLDRLVFSCTASQRKSVFTKIPSALHHAYLKQIYCRGI